MDIKSLTQEIGAVLNKLLTHSEGNRLSISKLRDSIFQLTGHRPTSQMVRKLTKELGYSVVRTKTGLAIDNAEMTTKVGVLFNYSASISSFEHDILTTLASEKGQSIDEYVYSIIKSHINILLNTIPDINAYKVKLMKLKSRGTLNEEMFSSLVNFVVDNYVRSSSNKSRILLSDFIKVFRLGVGVELTSEQVRTVFEFLNYEIVRQSEGFAVAGIVDKGEALNLRGITVESFEEEEEELPF